MIAACRLVCVLVWLALDPALAAISVVNGEPAQRNGNGDLTLNTPAATASGDVLIAHVVAKSGASITLPPGWVRIVPASASGSDFQQNIYALNLGGNSPQASYSWGIASNGGNRAAGVIYAVRGAANVDCSGGNTVSCAGSTQAPGANNWWIGAPQVSTDFPAGSLRMALFGVNNGSGLAINTGYNGKTATTGASLNTGSGTSGVSLAGMYYLRADNDPATSSYDGLSASPLIGASNVGSTLILRAAPALALTCVSDNFNRSNLGDDWVSVRVAGTFTPSIVGNRLRLTTADANQSTGVSFQRLFPAADNFIQLTYRYYGYGGSGADGIAVILSDAGITPQPGGFGGSLGYAPKAPTPGFAGGWLGVGLDEYGNFSNQNDSGPCAPGVTPCATSRVQQSVSIRGSAPNYYWLRGTATLNPTVSNTSSSNHLYRITIDSRVSGQTLVSVERDTTGSGNSYATLIGAFNAMTASGQAAVPENLVLSFTGSTGGSTNNHEIDDLQICAQRMSGMQAQIDHFRFSLSSTPLTCTPAEIFVQACMDANCSTTYSGEVTATLTPGGWVGGNTQTFAGSGATLQLANPSATAVTVGVSGSTPPTKAFSQTQCAFGGATYSTNCNLVFADAGLLVNIPTLTAGIGNNMTVAAVRASDNALQCVPAFASVSRSVKFWSNYSNPGTGTLPVKLGSSGTAVSISSTVLPGSSTTGTAMTLAFDASGRATVPIQYDDAGRVLLNARYDGSAATNDAGLVMTGSSAFVAVPHALCVDSPDANWQCSSSDTAALQNPANCSVFRQAGANFNLRVTGKAYSGSLSDICAMPTTPNYQQSNIPLTGAVVAPAGGDNGGLSAAAISITNGGTATVSVTQREVGVFTFKATPTAGSYLMGQTVPEGSGVFGRFIPAGFTLGASPLLNRVAASCSTPADFTYLGEQLGSDFTLSAVNLAGGPTRNYRDAFARLNLAPVASAGSNGLAFGAQDGSTLLNSRLSATCSSCPPFANGMTALQTRLAVGRAAGGAIDGPFAAACFGLVATDADGVGMRTPDFSWDLAGSADGVSLGTTRLVFGRLRVDNAYGSALLPLPVPVRAQAWGGSSFINHSADSCSPIQVPVTIAVNAGTFPALSCNGGVGLYGSLGGVVASAGSVAAGSTVRLVNGGLLLTLSKPADPAGGYLDLVLAAPEYLKFDWDGVDQSLPGCSTPGDGLLHDDNPRARIRFGVKTNQGVIHQREVY